MTFDTHFRTMMGVKPVQAVKALYEMGVRVIGANCGNGPAEIERIVWRDGRGQAGRRLPDRPVERGPAQIRDQGIIRYDGTPEVMAEYALKMKALGINYIGACCGSTPAHIAAMREALGG